MQFDETLTKFMFSCSNARNVIARVMKLVKMLLSAFTHNFFIDLSIW